MDIKAEIEKIIAKVTKDNSLQEKFKSDPAGTVKGLIGDAADNETIAKIVDAVKAAITSGGGISAIGGKITEALGGILGGGKKDE